MGKPVRKFTRMAIPLAPPGTILAGAAKLLIPTVYRKIPTTFRNNNRFCILFLHVRLYAASGRLPFICSEFSAWDPRFPHYSRCLRKSLSYRPLSPPAAEAFPDPHTSVWRLAPAFLPPGQNQTETQGFSPACGQAWRWQAPLRPFYDKYKLRLRRIPVARLLHQFI